MLKSDLFTTRATPFRVAMLRRIRERGDEEVVPAPRFQVTLRQFADAATPEGRKRFGRWFFELLRFNYFHRGAKLPERPRREFGGSLEGWPDVMGSTPRYRGGAKKRMRKPRTVPE
tara:strand:+ start:5055 stop:5402 length:348 start_codon:yes stop_codon:yes gene_type:complete